MLYFLVGALLGVILGGALCVQHLRQAMTADIVPKLKGVQGQLDHIEAELNLASSTWYAELSTRHQAPERSERPQRLPS
jgi:hypothetical protein